MSTSQKTTSEIITEEVLNRLISEAVKNNLISVIEEKDLPKHGYKQVRFDEPMHLPEVPDQSIHHPSSSTSRESKVSTKLVQVKRSTNRRMRGKQTKNSKPTVQPRQPRQRPQLPGQTKLTDYYKLIREATLE
jgi:hypothetical protein